LYYSGMATGSVSMSGLAGNIEVDFDQIFRVKPQRRLRNFALDLYIFGDIATFTPEQLQRLKGISIAADAGVGGILKINFGSYDIKPLYIRVDFPLWIGSSLKSSTQTYMVAGVGRTF
ncbi:MAG TPA: hypothetical protein VL947_02330, partial [Cytophagales bacterium]|nr:hypothetical protein [Cytophagales bacterium]